MYIVVININCGKVVSPQTRCFNGVFFATTNMQLSIEAASAASAIQMDVRYVSYRSYRVPARVSFGFSFTVFVCRPLGPLVDMVP